LHGATVEVNKEVRKATRARIKTAHLSAGDLEEAILDELAPLKNPVTTHEIIDALASNNGGRFQPADLEKTTDHEPRWEKNAR